MHIDLAENDDDDKRGLSGNGVYVSTWVESEHLCLRYEAEHYVVSDDSPHHVHLVFTISPSHEETELLVLH